MACVPVDWAKIARQCKPVSKWSKQGRKKASFVNTDDCGLPLGPFIMLQIQHAFLNFTPYICLHIWVNSSKVQTDIQPGYHGRGLGSAEWLWEANFHLCINQTGMWVQLIALGRHPTSKPFFPRVGPALCRDEQLDGCCPSLSWAGRIRVSKMHRSRWTLCLVSDFLCNPNEPVPLPSTLFNFTDLLEKCQMLWIHLLICPHP